MPAPLNPNLWPSVLHDENANPINSGNPLPVNAVVSPPTPGHTITTAPDTAVAPAAIVPLTVPPAGTLRMTVEVTGGDGTTRIRVREAGGAVGSGKLLVLLGSTVYGGDGGVSAIAALEVENVAGPAAAVMIQFERP